MKKTIIILILSIAVAAIAFFTVKNEKNATISNDFLLYDTSFVEQIFMVDKRNQQVTLTKKNNIWYVNNDLEAIGKNVDIILSTLMHIEIRRPVSHSARNSYVKKLATNSTKVEIYENKPLFNIFGLALFAKLRKTKVFYVGPPTKDFRGTVMKMEDSDELLITYLPSFNGYLTERFSANYGDWISHNIYKLPIKSIKSIRMEFRNMPNQSYEINNIGNRSFDIISLFNNQKVDSYDTTRMLEQLASFRTINYETVLDDMPQSRLDSILAKEPYQTLSVTTIDNNQKTIRMYRRPNYTGKPDFNGNYIDYDVDRMYAFVDGIKDPVTVQYFVFDNITRHLDFLLGKDVYGKATLETIPFQQKKK